MSRSYIETVMDRVAARFTPEECGKLEEMLQIVDRELMPEVGLPPGLEKGTWKNKRQVWRDTQNVIEERW